jgi:endonuclease/exonuclease/phosphatase family metal-dependent hydrolase
MNLEGEEGASLRVMAWNVKYAARRLPFWFDCWGDRVSMSQQEVEDNINALATLINEADPDVLMIEEVEVNSRRSAYYDMVQALLDKTQLNYAAYFASWDSRYVPSEGLGRVNLGNAILSKHRISSTARIRQQDRTDLDAVTEPFYLKRVVGRVVLELEGSAVAQVAAYVVHTEAYDVDGTKAAQIAHIKELLDQEPLPFVVGGDFNELPPNAARLEGFPDEREEALCSDEFTQPPYTPEVMRPFFEELQPSIPLELYGDEEGAQARFYTHSVLGPDEDNGRGWQGEWNRTLDYLFASPQSAWRTGSVDVLQRAGQRVGVIASQLNDSGEPLDALSWTLESDPLTLSDHAPTFGIWEVRP